MSATSDIDLSLYERARQQLGKLGLSATEFIQHHPEASKKQLAELIGNGVTARGLTMKLFEEARQQARVRTLARDLLYRKIVTEFPAGWYEDENVRPTVNLGSWHYDILEFAPEFEDSAASILRALMKNRPQPGWKPEDADDERLTLLFEENWTELA